MRWYSIDSNLNVVERGPVTKEEAMRIIEQYSRRAGATYVSVEDALAATMFGFQKGETEFVEICFQSPEVCSFRYEVTVRRKLWFVSPSKVFEKHMTFSRLEDVRDVVSAFFVLDSESFQSLLNLLPR